MSLVFFILSLCVLQTIIVLTSCFLSPDNPTFLETTDLLAHFLFPLKDFLIASSFTWLYYYQGTR
jgi:hypothetical protein